MHLKSWIYKRKMIMILTLCMIIFLSILYCCFLTLMNQNIYKEKVILIFALDAILSKILVFGSRFSWHTEEFVIFACYSILFMSVLSPISMWTKDDNFQDQVVLTHGYYVYSVMQ